MEEEKDQMLLNRYRVMSQIGEGASSVVYAAHDVKIGRDVAIKKIRVATSTTPRILREMRTIATLTHPGIVVMYDFEETPSYYHIIMEYLDGVTLRKVLKKQGKITIPQAITIATQLCDALEHAHSLEIVHRDIKPENIMVLKNGQVKLMDFGIAQLISRDDRERKIVGTLGYMSPEQITGRYVDETSDIFSLGIVIYEMLTGKNPLYTGTLKETAMQILTSTPLGPSSINPSVSALLDAVVLKAMAKDPEERFHSAKELGEKLKEFQQKDAQAEKVLKPITKSVSEQAASGATLGKQGIAASTYTYVKKREIEIRDVCLGLSVAGFCAFGLIKLAFYPLVVSLLIAAAIPFLAFHFPKIAIGVAALALVPPLFAKSAVHGLLGLIFLGFYYIYFGQRDIYAAVVPLFALIFAALKLEFLYVILVGLFLHSGIAFVTGALGAVFIEVLDLASSSKLRFTTAVNKFPMYPQINPGDFFGSLKAVFQPFFTDYFLLLQILLWGVTALAVSFPYPRVKNKMLARMLGVVLGSIILILGYALAPPLLKVPGLLINQVAIRLIVPIVVGLLLSLILEMGSIKKLRSSQ